MDRQFLTAKSDIKIFSHSGRVIDVKIWGDTQTFGSVYEGRGSISSVSHEKVRLFLRKDDGREHDLVLTDPGMGFKEDQAVSVVYCGHVKSDTGYVVGFMNHTSEKRIIKEHWIDGLIKTPTRYYWFGILSSPFVGGIFADFFESDQPGFALIVFVVVTFSWLFLWLARRRMLKRRVAGIRAEVAKRANAELDRLNQNIVLARRGFAAGYRAD